MTSNRSPLSRPRRGAPFTVLLLTVLTVLGAQTLTGTGVFSTALIPEWSEKIATQIKAASEDIGASFIDVRPELRAAAAHDVIDGPKDWNHLNKLGQEALADAILKHARAQHVFQ